MTAPVLVTGAGAPASIDPALAVVLSRRFNSMMGGRELPSELALSPDQRLALQARAARLDAGLQPGREKAVLIAISGMLGVLPGKNGSVDDAGPQRRAYQAAVATLPGFAVLGACNLALTQGIGDKRFAPTPPELRETVLALAHPFFVEKARIAAVLAAAVAPSQSSPDRRAELAAAARRAFRIPEPEARFTSKPSTPSPPGDLGDLGRDILRRSGLNRIIEPVVSTPTIHDPADRSQDEEAA